MKILNRLKNSFSLLVLGAIAFSTIAPRSTQATSSTVLVAASGWMGSGGVAVYSNFAPIGGEYAEGIRWQCVELACRLFKVKGWGFPGPITYAYQIYGDSNIGVSYANGGGYVPVPGDLIVWAHDCGGMGSAGHV